MIVSNNEVILFQGDSITDGNRGRNNDLNHILGHGYQYIISAKLLVDFMDKNITCINRGISGNRISDLYGRWKEDCLTLNPTVLSILVGINDVSYEWNLQAGSDKDRYRKIYKLLINEAREMNPDLKLIIMEPFFGKLDDSERSLYFDRQIRVLASVARELAEEYNAVFVPLQDMFDSYFANVDTASLIWDGIHPTAAGHELIARQWLNYVDCK